MATTKSAELLRAESDLDSSRRGAALRARFIGACVAAAGAVLAYTVYEGMAVNAVYSVELLYMATWGLSAGGMLIVLGVGGAPRVRDVPTMMWAAWAGASALLALLAFVPLGRILAGLTGFEDI